MNTMSCRYQWRFFVDREFSASRDVVRPGLWGWRCGGLDDQFPVPVASAQFSLNVAQQRSKRPMRIHFPISQQSLQGCPPPPPPRTSLPSPPSTNAGLVVRRSFLPSEDGTPTTSFLCSSFLRAISAVMLWPVHVQKISHASKYLYPAKLSTSYDVVWAC